MHRTSTITIKIKQGKVLRAWFLEQSKSAAKLYNECLNLQFELVDNTKPILSAFDLANHFRLNPLASDYKDRIFERTADSTKKWVKSELLRYEIYWRHIEEKNRNKSQPDDMKSVYPFLASIEEYLEWQEDYRNHIKSLHRKQVLFGRPKRRKKCSLAFSIRKGRQSTIQFTKRKAFIAIPKFKSLLNGIPNFLPATSTTHYKLATLKMDNCKTLWLKLTVEDKESGIVQNPAPPSKTPAIIVGVDMGLKTTRTAVAVRVEDKKIVDIYQPVRERFFDKAYQALVWASTHDKRHLAYVYRKIARRRRDNIDKDSIKIISMGDEFKFGKPGTAFLLSGRLARSASDAANSLFLTRFAKRAEIAGKIAGEVNESNTSVTCRICGRKKQMPLYLRVYECKYCEHSEDRDINSAYQIAFRDILEKPAYRKRSNRIKTNKNGMLLGREMKSAVKSLRDF